MQREEFANRPNPYPYLYRVEIALKGVSFASDRRLQVEPGDAPSGSRRRMRSR